MAPATVSAPSAAATPADPAGEAAVGEILDLVHARCGTAFHGYRRATVVRRIRNRMIAAGVPTLGAYAALLRADRREAARLLERLTLKVSRLWRNPAAVSAVAGALSGRSAARAWSAGCARGEEAYTLGMLLADASGGRPWSVLGTDVDAEALAEARRGRYGAEALADVPEEVARRHLEPPGLDGRRAVRPAVRAGVAFEVHDLVGAEVPPSAEGYDLVACRNVLIYLEAPARRRVEELLAAALAPAGLLWLGEAEWPSPALAARLTVLDRRARLFQAGGAAA